MPVKIHWKAKHFNQLNLDELYELLKLRSDVFVVEQNCVYLDIDGDKGCFDRHNDTIHLLGYQSAQEGSDLGDKLIAHLRILAKGQSYPEHISIGRVVTAQHVRGKGLGHALMAEGLLLCQRYFPNEAIKISAQQHLKSYYAHHGFEQVSEMYLEDGIPHIAMVKR